jgi:tryptophan-rich sensory protein
LLTRGPVIYGEDDPAAQPNANPDRSSRRGHKDLDQVNPLDEADERKRAQAGVDGETSRPKRNGVRLLDDFSRAAGLRANGSESDSARLSSRNLLSGLIALLLVMAAVSLCVLVKYPNFVPWYAELKKPWFILSNTIFGSVWIALYLLMAFAFGRILRLRSKTPGRWLAIWLFLGQLGLNVLWALLFFGAHSPFLGLIDIVPQWFLIVATIAAVRPLDRAAALALVPLGAWVAFVGVLNFAIWRLN